MATRSWSFTTIALCLASYIFLSQGSTPSHTYDTGLRESAAKRGRDLARAPDGSIATDAPLPVIRAHSGVRDASSDDSPSSPGATLNDPPPQSVSLWLILAMTMVMALLSGVGALPYLFTGKLDPYWSGIANAVGCGVMLAASFDLLEESKSYSATLVLGGIVLGVLAMAYSQAWLSRFEDVSFSDLQGADARKAMLILGVMAAHAFGEGSGVGVSFSGPRGWAQGLLVTIAIGLHNIPEGMAVATIMVARGTPPRTALYWTLLSALPQGVVAVPSYVFVETFSGLLPIALGFAAGCMIWIVFAELIPDALETAEHGHVATAATLSAAALQCISMVIAKLERADGSVASPIAADLTLLLPDLLLLLPAFLAPAAAAGLAARLLPSLPLSMGVSVGVGTWAGLAGLLGCLAKHHLEKHTALLWAGAGAAACAGVWRALAAVAIGGSGTGSVERKDSGGGGEQDGTAFDLVKAETGASDLHHRHQPQQQQQQHPASQLLQSEQVAEGSAPLSGTGWVAGKAGQPGEAGSWGHYQQQQQQQQQQVQQGQGYPYGSGVGGVTTVHATGVAAGRGGSVTGQMLERRNGFGSSNGTGTGQFGGGDGGAGTGGALDGNGGGGGGGGFWAQQQQQQQQQGMLHCQGNCSCKDCDSKKPSSSGGGGGCSSWGAPMDLLPGLDRPRECVRAALLLGAMLLLQCVPVAYEAAGALVQHLGDSSSLMVPLALRGVALGVACVGVARAAAGAPGWHLPAALAGLLALTTAATAVLLLAPLPVGRVTADEIDLDATHAGDKLRAFASGGLLLASVGYMWPAAAPFKPRRVQLGVSLGLGLAAGVALVGAGLCAGTPYCLTAK